jgi:FAD-linked oxidoreductase
VSQATWRDWTGEQRCEPAIWARPSTSGELAAALERAAAAGHGVRVAGAGHSSSPAVLTEGMLLSLDRMSSVIEVDRSSGLVRAQAGITLRRLSDELWDAGLALNNVGDIDVQSLAGALATGTHGTGIRFPNMSAEVESIELMRADGCTVELSHDADPHGWRSARVALGALGVVTAVTLRTVPAFLLDSAEAPLPLGDVLSRLDELVAGSDHFGFFTFPFSEVAMTYTHRRARGEPQPRSAARTWVEDHFVKNHLYHAICRAGRARPSLIPRLNGLVGRLASSSRRLDRSYRIFATPRTVPFVEMEFAIPRARAAEAVTAVRAAVERERYPVSFPLEVRFAAPDDAYLSPAFGRETCFVTVHIFRGLPWKPYFEDVQNIMLGLGGRPHWGKAHFLDARELRPAYAEWDRFADVRARLDPGGRFTNDYVRRVLGAPLKPGASGVSPPASPP